MLQYGNRRLCVDPSRRRDLVDTLSAAGLNLVAVLPLRGLLPTLRRSIAARPTERTLILVGHAGARLWRRLPAARLRRSDPIDTWSVEVTRRAISDQFPGIRQRIVFPGPVNLPLQQLGQIAGWSHRSPLGSGVNRRYGPWFAYRCAVLVEGRLPRRVTARGLSPCAGCRERPCIAECPASALSVEFAPDVSACGQYRLRPDSPCADRCLAREACPVGRRHRYPVAAMRYHYRDSLSVVRRLTGVPPPDPRG